MAAIKQNCEGQKDRKGIISDELKKYRKEIRGIIGMEISAEERIGFLMKFIDYEYIASNNREAILEKGEDI